MSFLRFRVYGTAGLSRVGSLLVSTLILVTLCGCTESKHNAEHDRHDQGPAEDLGPNPGRDAGTADDAVSAVMVRGQNHSVTGWPYHVLPGALVVLRVQDGGRVTLLPHTPCEGYRVPLEGRLTAVELDEFGSLLRRQGDFVELVDTVCSAFAMEGGESVAIGRKSGVVESAGAWPAFRPWLGCSPADRPLHPEGTLELTDWMRARTDDPEFVARLAPALSDVVRVTRVDPTLWESEGRPVPPAVSWTFAGLRLADLEARVRPQDREPFVDYAATDRAALWDLCLNGYALWSEVSSPHDICMDVAVFAAEEGDRTYLLACGAPPMLSVFSPPGQSTD